jgi:hypothetical protein
MTINDNHSFEASVDMAAELIASGEEFYRAVSRAAEAYGFEWFAIQQALAHRSAEKRSRVAAASNAKVEEIKALTRAHRERLKQQAKAPEKPATLF